MTRAAGVVPAGLCRGARAGPPTFANKRDGERASQSCPLRTTSNPFYSTARISAPGASGVGPLQSVKNRTQASGPACRTHPPCRTASAGRLWAEAAPEAAGCPARGASVERQNWIPGPHETYRRWDKHQPAARGHTIQRVATSQTDEHFPLRLVQTSRTVTAGPLSASSGGTPALPSCLGGPVRRTSTRRQKGDARRASWPACLWCCADVEAL